MSALLDQVLKTIRARREEFETRFGIHMLGVVGSLARGEERADSDVDITFKVMGATTFFKISDAEFELEQELGRKVDLVDRDGLRPAARSFIERDLVSV